MKRGLFFDRKIGEDILHEFLFNLLQNSKKHSPFSLQPNIFFYTTHQSSYQTLSAKINPPQCSIKPCNNSEARHNTNFAGSLRIYLQKHNNAPTTTCLCRSQKEKGEILVYLSKFSRNENSSD